MCMYVIVCDGMYFSVEIVDRNFLFSGVNITAGRARDKSVHIIILYLSLFFFCDVMLSAVHPIGLVVESIVMAAVLELTIESVCTACEV